MSTKQKCKGYCMEFLNSRGCGFAFNQSEFDRQFKGCSLLNPVTVGLQIADNLIFNYRYNQNSHESRNEA